MNKEQMLEVEMKRVGYKDKMMRELIRAERELKPNNWSAVRIHLNKTLELLDGVEKLPYVPLNELKKG